MVRSAALEGIPSMSRIGESGAPDRHQQRQNRQISAQQFALDASLC
jgi:hypothetical protein